MHEDLWGVLHFRILQPLLTYPVFCGERITHSSEKGELQGEKEVCVCGGGEGRLEFTLLPVHAQKALQ